MQRHQVQRTLGRRPRSFLHCEEAAPRSGAVCLREDAAATEGRQDRLEAVTTPCDGASRPAQRGSAVALRLDLLARVGRREWTGETPPSNARGPVQGTPAARGTHQRKSLAGVVVGEAA